MDRVGRLYVMLLSVCLAATVLAGCTQAPIDPSPVDPKDPAGDQETGSGSGADQGDADDPGDGPDPDDGDDGDGSEDGDAQDDPHEETVEHEGTTLALYLVSGPETLATGQQGTWEFALENRGDQGVELVQGCDHEWNGPSIHDADGRQVPHQPPMGQCDGFMTVIMEPGEAWRTNTTWDGSLYEGDDGEPTGQAEPGDYTVHLEAARTMEEWTFLLRLEVPFTLSADG